MCSHLRNMASAVDQYSRSQPNQEASLIFDPTSATSTSFFQASTAPVAIARETEDSGRRTHEGYRGMCSDPVHSGGEVRGCSVGCTIAMSDVYFVFIVAAGKNIRFLGLKKCFFKRGCFGCSGIFWCSDWHKILILLPLHWMSVWKVCRTPHAALYSLL